jgi:hypothetical protein
LGNISKDMGSTKQVTGDRWPVTSEKESIGKIG